jgi:hypothetical protein
MDARSGEDMGANQIGKRPQNRSAGPNIVS